MLMTDANLRRIVGDEYRLDDLCPDCHLPSMWAFPVYDLDGDTVHLSHTWHACTDCGHRERRNAA